MMELGDAIKHAEDIANMSQWGSGNRKCENEHRQLAEWLKELKRYRTAIELLHKEQRANQADFNYCEGYHDALSNVVRMIEFGEDWDNDD